MVSAPTRAQQLERPTGLGRLCMNGQPVGAISYIEIYGVEIGVTCAHLVLADIEDDDEQIERAHAGMTAVFSDGAARRFELVATFAGLNLAFVKFIDSMEGIEPMEVCACVCGCV